MLLTKLKAREIPWRVLSVEAVLIVVSVLLALALEGWREERKQRALGLPRTVFLIASLTARRNYFRF